jgi:hypothetical protein
MRIGWCDTRSSDAIMGGMPPAPRPPTQDQTIAALLESTNRSILPIRKTFVQQPDGKRYVGGPLHKFVANQDQHGLDQYLLFHAKASGGDWTVTLGAPVWARAMGRQANSTGLTAVSKAWNRIEGHGLIRRSRSGRKAQIQLLREDGSGANYTRPKTAADDRWFSLPYEYWHEHWHQKLSLPGKAMLLIALSLDDGFYLPFPKAEEWYSISRNTAQRGMSDLVGHGLIEKDEEWVEETLSDIGHRLVVKYTLLPPFGPHEDRRKKEAANRRAKAGAVRKTKRRVSTPTKRTRALAATKGAALN